MTPLELALMRRKWWSGGHYFSDRKVFLCNQFPVCENARAAMGPSVKTTQV